jgi:hypothetical protein
MRNKKSFLLIGLGGINILHAGLHLLQFIQSIILVTNSSHCEDEDGLLHNPIFNLIWAIVGLLTLYVGIKDFRHHNHCHDVDKHEN